MTSILKIGGDILGASAKKKASKKAQKAQEAAQAQVREVTQKNIDTVTGLYKDQAATGAIGLKALTDGYATGDFTRSFGDEDFQADPGYQFRKAEGEKSIQRAAASKGSFYSGAQLKALNSYDQNIASEEYGKARARFNEDQNKRFTAATTLTNLGVNANNSTAAAYNLGSQQIANSYGETGKVQAQGALERGAISANLISNVVNDGISAIGDAVSFGAGGGTLGGSLGSLASIFKKAPTAGGGYTYSEGA